MITEQGITNFEVSNTHTCASSIFNWLLIILVRHNLFLSFLSLSIS